MKETRPRSFSILVSFCSFFAPPASYDHRKTRARRERKDKRKKKGLCVLRELDEVVLRALECGDAVKFRVVLDIFERQKVRKNRCHFTYHQPGALQT